MATAPADRENISVSCIMPENTQNVQDAIQPGGIFKPDVSGSARMNGLRLYGL